MLTLLVGLVVACFFYGVGLNLLFILPVLLCAGIVLATIPARDYADRLRTAPLFMFGCLATMVGLAIQHTFFSFSPDTSFAPTLIAICLPLYALVTALICSSQAKHRLLLQLVCGGVFVFAGISAADFIFFQQRAHAPLWDPNNYVTLLYIAWLPWLFIRLNQPITGRGITLNVSICFAVCLAMLATHSRVAMLVVVGAALGLVLARWWYRLAGATVASMCLGCLLAGLVYLGTDLSGAASAFSNTATVGASSESQRLMMISSTLAAFKDFGSLSGTGLYTFTLLYPIFRSPLEQNTTASFVHNDYLQLALETGIWGLLPLVFLLVVVVVSGMRRIVGTRQLDPRAGALIGIGCALLHASVNFVVYVLPLTVMLGLLLGLAFVPFQEARPLKYPIRLSLARGIKIILLSTLGLNGAFLGLDALSYGVFSGQLYVPGAAQLRQTPQSMLEFSRLAQTLNPSRGVPVLAEAQILRNSLALQSSALTKSQTQAAFRKAQLVDPWNPHGYIKYAEFLRAYPELAAEDAQTQQHELLNQALSLNPADAATNQALLDHHIRTGDGVGVLQVVRNGLQWCETIRRRGSARGEKLLRDFSVIAAKVGEQAIIDNLVACQERDYSAAANGLAPTWMMRWLRAQHSMSSVRQHGQ